MLIKLGDVNLLEFGQEQCFYTIAGLYQAESGITMGEAEGLLDGNGKQWRQTAHLDLVVDKIRKV